MAQGTADKQKTGKEFGQLIRLHERLLHELQQVRDELVAPTTKQMVAAFQAKTGSAPEGLGSITTAVEEAIRALKLSESALRREIVNEAEHTGVDGINNMPAALARFLAERSENPNFRYEVIQDENRGWIIRWKEHTFEGRVRGSGQFYERPYAWLED